MTKAVTVRAFYRCAKAPGSDAPYDAINIKVYYPAAYGNRFAERDTGFIPADADRGPFPVALILPGINLSHEGYGWLAQRLAAAGFVALTYSWTAREFNGLISLSPGLQTQWLTPEGYGKQPSCPALPPLFAELEALQQEGLLAGLLDLENIVLGGHSAGGSMALLNANQDWFPRVRGAFSYAAHTAGNAHLGWKDGAIMPLFRTPLLIMGGNRDGVIAASRHRYGGKVDAIPSADHATDSVLRTFREGAPEGSRLLIVEGANHFSLVWPQDAATGRPFLDWRVQGSGRAIRQYLAQAIVSFCAWACGNRAAAKQLDALCNEKRPLAALAERK